MIDESVLPAYGGPGWEPRSTHLREEMGSLWGRCGIDSEWRPLKAVLLHRPGREMEGVAADPRGSLMLDAPDPGRMTEQHDRLAELYRAQGVAVHYVDPQVEPPPNLIFAADLMVMTPEGAIVGRPASRMRAGEERWVARALAELGAPILRSVRGSGTFEGADLMWLAPTTALLGQGIRTNADGAAQVRRTLEEIGVRVVDTLLPPGTMHLMGQLRIVDAETAIAWPGRFPGDAVRALEDLGYRVHLLPSDEEARSGAALNFVVLGPRKILMPVGNGASQAFYEELGVECITAEVDEIGKAAGSIGCATGVVEREREG